ncbi:MAG: response regulator, partial [Myxococcales bacterium]
MEPARILIVENDQQYALSLAAVLRSAGFQTALAGDAGEAHRELEKRKPNLLVLRAELPDRSGFSVCGMVKKRFPGLPVVLVTSAGPQAINEHRASASAANRYLAVGFELPELASVASELLSAPVELDAAAVSPGGDDDVEAAFGSMTEGSKKPEPAPAPPPIPANRPPPVPRRERRSAITDEDRQFLDRTFSSISDRKAELLAEARNQVKRPPVRSELLATPEGKLQVLRDELKSREAQIARISEVWASRERELLSVEDRLHEKDVEVQGLKMQIDDLLRRFNDAQQAFLQKEKEHGATVDDMLLQRFSQEKELIEVVAAKEK